LYTFLLQLGFKKEAILHSQTLLLRKESHYHKDHVYDFPNELSTFLKGFLLEDVLRNGVLYLQNLNLT
jgi:hypothetical protein